LVAANTSLAIRSPERLNQLVTDALMIPLTPPDPNLMAKIDALIEEMTKGGRAPGDWRSREHEGRRAHPLRRWQALRHRWTVRGIEVIAGYAIVDLPSKTAAIEWAIRFGDVVKVNEIEVRQMPEW
jgi:hypothetical protein